MKRVRCSSKTALGFLLTRIDSTHTNVSTRRAIMVAILFQHVATGDKHFVSFASQDTHFKSGTEFLRVKINITTFPGISATILSNENVLVYKTKKRVRPSFLLIRRYPFSHAIRDSLCNIGFDWFSKSTSLRS